MKVLISGGVKSNNIVNGIQAKFGASGDEFIVIPYIEDINKIYSRGDYFDKAIISEQSITRDGEISLQDDVILRDKINKFAIDSAKRGRKATYVFLSKSDEMALKMQEEILALNNNSVVVYKEPPYSVQFFVELIVTDIAQLPKSWVFKAPTIGTSIYNNELFAGANIDDIEDENEPEVVIQEASEDNSYDYFEDTVDDMDSMDNDIDLPDDIFNDDDIADINGMDGTDYPNDIEGDGEEYIGGQSAWQGEEEETWQDENTVWQGEEETWQGEEEWQDSGDNGEWSDSTGGIDNTGEWNDRDNWNNENNGEWNNSTEEWNDSSEDAEWNNENNGEWQSDNSEWQGNNEEANTFREETDNGEGYNYAGGLIDRGNEEYSNTEEYNNINESNISNYDGNRDYKDSITEPVEPVEERQPEEMQSEHYDNEFTDEQAGNAQRNNSNIDEYVDNITDNGIGYEDNIDYEDNIAEQYEDNIAEQYEDNQYTVEQDNTAYNHEYVDYNNTGYEDSIDEQEVVKQSNSYNNSTTNNDSNSSLSSVVSAVGAATLAGTVTAMSVANTLSNNSSVGRNIVNTLNEGVQSMNIRNRGNRGTQGRTQGRNVQNTQNTQMNNAGVNNNYVPGFDDMDDEFIGNSNYNNNYADNEYSDNGYANDYVDNSNNYTDNNYNDNNYNDNGYTDNAYNENVNYNNEELTGFDNNDDMYSGYDDSMYAQDEYANSNQPNQNDNMNMMDNMVQNYSQDNYNNNNMQTGVSNEEVNSQMRAPQKRGLLGIFKKGSGNKSNNMEMTNNQALNQGPAGLVDSGNQFTSGEAVNTAMPIMDGKGKAININKVRDKLRPFAARGNAITVTGFGGSGTSTVAYSLANIICQLGYTVLLVDFDVEGRTQSYITRTNYETMEPDGANIMAAVNSSTGISRQMSIVKEGFHLLTMGLGADVHPIGDIIKKEKLTRFFNAVKNEHQFVIYDIPFNIATDHCSEITYNSDNIVAVADCSNWGIAKMLLQICNIKSEDMQDTMFNRAQIVFNKHRNLGKVFGQRFNNAYDILKIMDKQVLDLVGEDIGFHFQGLTISGIIDDDKSMEDGWFGDSHYSDTRKGQNIFIELLQNIVLKK